MKVKANVKAGGFILGEQSIQAGSQTEEETMKIQSKVKAGGITASGADQDAEPTGPGRRQETPPPSLLPQAPRIRPPVERILLRDDRFRRGFTH